MSIVVVVVAPGCCYSAIDSNEAILLCGYSKTDVLTGALVWRTASCMDISAIDFV